MRNLPNSTGIVPEVSSAILNGRALLNSMTRRGSSRHTATATVS